jgi:uncharacterized protein YndB with AHSA1/START domain
MQHQLERTVVIRAQPATVFASFTDNRRFAAWWGPGSTIEPKVGGAVHIRYPNGIVASGNIRAIERDRRIVFTYGYEDGKGPVPPGATEVEVTLAPHALGTELRLVHRFGAVDVRDAHVPGWWYQLAVFSNVVANEQHADLDARCDRFFAAQSVDGIEARRAALAALVTDSFTFRDRFANLVGAHELAIHIEGARMHGAAPTIERDGKVEHCQGTAVCHWLVRGPDGTPVFRGRNVMELASDGRFASVVGLWS